MRSKQALTLMEVLVSIAIISVLVALLAPVLAEARRRGHRATALAHVRQLSFAALAYEADSEGLPPYEDLREGYWLKRIGLVVGTKATLLDPTFRQPPPSRNLVTLTGYALNGCLGSYVAIHDTTLTVLFATVGEFAEVNVEGISELNVVVLAAPDSIAYGEIARKQMRGTNQELIVRQEFGSLRHSGSGVYSFADGHAKAHKPEDFVYPAKTYLCTAGRNTRLSRPAGGPTFLPNLQSAGSGP